MRDYLLLLIVFSLLPFGFRRPFFGLLLFNWLAYMRPHDLTWGIAKTFNLSQYAGMALLFGWAAFEMGKRPFARWDIRTVCMTFVLVTTVVSTLFAERQDEYVIDGLVEFTKIITISLVTTGMVDTRQRLRLLNWVVALGLGFYGTKSGIWGIASGGGHIHNGPGGLMKDNNDFALALVMSLPMVWYMGSEEKRKLVTLGARIIVFLTAITIILTHSRGGFLAMTAAFGVIAFRSGHLLRAGLGVGIGAVLFLNLAPDSVLNRLGTIEDAAEGEADSSVDGRFRAWAIGVRMIEHNPILGVGHKNFRDHYQRHAYALFPGEEHFNHVAHNSYVQMWSETGTFAFAAFMVMLGSAFFAARTLRRWAKERPDMAWCKNYGSMIEATTLGFMIGGTFLNRAHFDLIWHWMAVTTTTMVIARRQRGEGAKVEEKRGSEELRAASARTAERPVVAPVGRPVWGRAPAGAAGARPQWLRGVPRSRST